MHRLQLTLADLVAEAHDTHHPIAASLYYDDQKPAPRAAARAFRKERVPKFLGYFHDLLSKQRYLTDARATYADLSLVQVIEGLRYAFPKNMARIEKTVPRLTDLRQRVAGRANIGAYLAFPRRIPFNTNGIFRHYPELDRLRSLRLPNCSAIASITIIALAEWTEPYRHGRKSPYKLFGGQNADITRGRPRADARYSSGVSRAA